MTTIRDIAMQCDCSASTVSLVFQGDDRISSATVEKVIAAARKLGYSPKPSKKPAKASKTRRILLITEKERSDNPPVYDAIFEGIEKACGEQHIHLSWSSLAKFEMILRNQEYFDGVIYGMLGDASRQEEVFNKINIPIIRVMGGSEFPEYCDHVTYNNDMVGKLAGKYLIDKGHKHIGIIVAQYVNDANNIFYQRVKSASKFIQSQGGNVEELCLPRGITNDELCETLSEYLLKNKGKVTALYSCFDAFTILLYQMLYKAGIIPGRDIEVISCNNEKTILEQLHPEPVSIDLNSKSIGMNAVRQLLWRIENPNEPLMTLQLLPQLNI